MDLLYCDCTEEPACKGGSEPLAMVQSRQRALLAGQAVLCRHAYELCVVEWSHPLMLPYMLHH